LSLLLDCAMWMMQQQLVGSCSSGWY
jgi:hypothetical protein